MKTLLIHPKDTTTDFLCKSYNDDFTLIRTNISKSLLLKLIRSHDLIIMMGHGTDKGLIGFDKYVIDSSLADELRKKICVCIWCYASDFVKKYELETPFSTGMFISEIDEVYLEGLNYSEDYLELRSSNYHFSRLLKNSFHDLDFQQLIKHYNTKICHACEGKGVTEYGICNNCLGECVINRETPIFKFNSERFYFNTKLKIKR